MIDTAKRLDGIQEYYFASKLREIAQRRAEGRQVLNLGIGSPDLPPAPAVTAALQQTASDPAAHGYQSYTGIPALRTAFADWYQQHYDVQLSAQDEILPLLGSKEGIVHIAMTYLEAGDTALAPDPGYPAYRAATCLAGANPQFYTLQAENGWEPDWEALEATDLSRVKLMWVNYPHMPTGAPAKPALFERLVAFGRRHNILIVNDNPYSFILNKQPLSIFSIPGAKEVCLELNSLSKSQNMAGWRVGMVAGAAKHIQNILRFKSNMDSGMFLAVQMAAIAALQLPAEWYRSLNAVYTRRRVRAQQLLQALDCRVEAGQQGLFLWGKVSGRFQGDGYRLSDAALYEQDVFITPGGIFGKNGAGYVRVSLCSDESILETALQRVQNLS